MNWFQLSFRSGLVCSTSTSTSTFTYSTPSTSTSNSTSTVACAVCDMGTLSLSSTSSSATSAETTTTNRRCRCCCRCRSTDRPTDRPTAKRKRREEQEEEEKSIVDRLPLLFLIEKRHTDVAHRYDDKTATATATSLPKCFISDQLSTSKDAIPPATIKPHFLLQQQRDSQRAGGRLRQSLFVVLLSKTKNKNSCRVCLQSDRFAKKKKRRR